VKRNLYLGQGGAHKRASEVHVGRDAEWKPARARLVGFGGRWRESFDGEPSDEGAVRVDYMSFRGGTPWQSDLAFVGQGLSGIAVPSPRDFAFYSLRNNFAEFGDNFGPMVPQHSGTPPLLSLDNGGGIQFTAAHQQYLTQPVDTESGFDLNGLIGTTIENGNGRRYWQMGMQFYPTLQPSAGNRIVLWHAGVQHQRLFLYYDSSLDLVFRWEGALTKEARIPAAVTLGAWLGVFLEHDDVAGTLTMRTHTGSSATIGALPYFVPALTEEQARIHLARGYTGGAVVEDTEYFQSGNTHSAFAISGTGSRRLTYAGNTYRTAQPGGVIQPETGLYYVELLYTSGFDLRIGFAAPGTDLSAALGIDGWCVTTINGRTFDHQTGGGTNWTAAVPEGSVIGILYDSDLGSFEYLVDGVSRGKPFPDGEITIPVQFALSGRGNTSTGSVLDVTVRRVTAHWNQEPSGILQEFPISSSVASESLVYYQGQIRSYFLRNAPMATANTPLAVIDPAVLLEVVWRSVATGEEFVGNEYAVKMEDLQLLSVVPNLPPGDYEVQMRLGAEASAWKAFTIDPFEYTTEELRIDFSRTEADEIQRLFIKGHKAWGGINGGIIKENVWWNEAEGLLYIRACGDDYTGPLRGVDNRGKRDPARTKCIGGALVTRGYYGPASYRVRAALPASDGVVTAFWTFHYEESYPGHPLYEEHQADGLHQSGSQEAGFYIVRNHEIDIEIPSALKADPDHEVVSYLNGRFNTWQGELRNWDVEEGDPEYFSEYTDEWVTHGVPVNDGEFHDFRFDWHLGLDPRVEFYIDEKHVTTVRTHVPDIPGRFWIALWFPRAPGNHWGGFRADFDEEYIKVQSVIIEPFLQEADGARERSESYPLDAFRDFLASRSDD
jgi:hypothetical protein